MKTSILTIVLTVVISTTILASCKSTTSLGENSVSATASTGLSDQVRGNAPVAAGNEEFNLRTPDKKPTYGDDSAQCVLNYYLYRQSFRDWENSGDEFYFDDLMPAWTYVFVHCPGYRVNTFINGVKIYEHRISKLPDNQKKNAIDTLMSIYDERILYYGEEAFVLGEKATAMVKHCPEKTEDIYKLLQKVVKLNKYNTANHLNVYYMQYAVFMHEAGKLSLEELIDIYLEVDEIANHNVSQNNPASAEYAGGISSIEQLMLNYLECDIMQNVFGPKYMADSTNVELLKKIIGLMAYKKCYDQPVFRNALRQLNRMEPTPRLLMIQGNFYYNDANYTEAINSYRRAAESFSDKEVNERYEAWMKIAEIQLIQKAYQNAKSSVQRALDLKSDDPDALILLGDIYLFGAGTCGTAIIAKHAGFWAAFDKYTRARNLSNDPVIQSKANNGISNARRGFPLTSDLFFNNLKPGQSVTAPCWIGETVIIRASDS
jgi:tetratricopeptide (TPR) repeat protein